MLTIFRKSLFLTFVLLLVCLLNLNNAFSEGSTLSYQQIRQAAESGDPDAEYALGYMLYYGKSGVTKDQAEAKKWIGRAAGHKQPQAIRALQLMGMKTPTIKEEKITVNTPPTQPIQKEETPPSPADQKEEAPGETYIDMSKHEKKDHPASQQALNIPDNSYTLQLLASANRNKVASLLQEYHLEDQGKIYHTQHDSKEWYILVYGTYTTKAEAKLAAEQLKKKTKIEPWVKPYSQVRKSLVKG